MPGDNSEPSCSFSEVWDDLRNESVLGYSYNVILAMPDHVQYRVFISGMVGTRRQTNRCS